VRGPEGTNPKIKVRDAEGDRWTVKFGGENHSDVFASRVLNALGYTAEPSYFVAPCTRCDGTARVDAIAQTPDAFSPNWRVLNNGHPRKGNRRHWPFQACSGRVSGKALVSGDATTARHSREERPIVQVCC
jgi:hypothetical protein